MSQLLFNVLAEICGCYLADLITHLFGDQKPCATFWGMSGLKYISWPYSVYSLLPSKVYMNIIIGKVIYHTSCDVQLGKKK